MTTAGHAAAQSKTAAKTAKIQETSMNPSAIANAIAAGKTALGVEFGSTRIKAVLVGEDNAPIASGSHEWENRFENGVWTYHLEDVWSGPAGRLPAAQRRGLRPLRRAAAHHRRHRLQRHDARLPALRQGRQAARPLPHLAQHHDRRRPPSSSPACWASTFPSAGASPTSTRRS